MQKRYNKFNPKRKIKKLGAGDQEHLNELAAEVCYGGNSEHKKNAGSFKLTPPSGPRPGKSLCDSAGINSPEEALKYLKLGLRKGLISERYNGKWPQNVWSVSDGGCPLEAQLDNQMTGSYHGYPMPKSDPLADEIVRLWHQNDKIQI